MSEYKCFKTDVLYGLSCAALIIKSLMNNRDKTQSLFYMCSS